MALSRLDLDHQLDCLRGLHADLEEHFWSRIADGAAVENHRYALGVAIGQLSQRIACIEEIARHYGSQTLRPDGLAVDEARALERALEVLDGEFVIEDDLAAATMWSRVRRILSAVDDLLVAAARAIPALDADETRPAGRAGVVVALARSK